MTQNDGEAPDVYISFNLGCLVRLHWLDLEWREMLSAHAVPALNQRFTPPPAVVHHFLVLFNSPLHPAIPLVCHHHYLVAFAAIFVFFPRCLFIRESVPSSCVLGRNVLESLRRVAKLVRFEHVVDVDPVMRLLPEGTGSERIANVEHVPIDLLVCVLGEILC